MRRLNEIESDKFLEVVTPTDLKELLDEIPECRAIVTTGQKATDIIVSTFGCEEPAVGQYSRFNIGEREMRFWRMPSSSRAYPLAIEKKAEHYKRMFEQENLI